ncbi:MAG: alginate export family protein [Verrucomicrobia bacterium]|jgi:hypothetical protein|nr:alginate export family protein [Verrucomicrobiota bacterium]
MTFKSLRLLAAIAGLFAAADSNIAAEATATVDVPASPKNPLHYSNGPVDLKFSIEASAQGSVGRHAFWGLAQTFAPAAGYPTEHYWLESCVKPGLTVNYHVSDQFTLYGGAAIIGSSTLGKDVFEQENEGKVLPENAYLGIRWQDASGDFKVDLSGGQQSYVLGNQFLIAVGAGNGFERGAVTTFPYRAWEMAGIARATWRQLTLEGFYLDPNELESNDLHNRLAGVNLKWEPRPGQFAGLAFVKVLESEYPYPQAPVTVIPNGRDGLEAFDGYWKWAPTEGALAGFSFLGEVVLQRNERINMEAWGGGVEIGYRFFKLPFVPRLSYSPRYFSGDDPGTSGRLERFDPLFYLPSPDTWSSGGNSSLGLLNANIIAHRVRLELTMSQRDFLNLNYWYVQAAEANSPLQFGQAARVEVSGGAPVLVSGVPDRELSHEFYVEYIHMFSQHVFLTAGIAGSFPGQGLRDIITTGAHDWWGGLINLTLKF